MTIVRFDAVGKEYGARSVFRNASFQIGRGERWGIVGQNGAGKSTLLRLLTGEDQASEGEVWLHPGLSISLLRQERLGEGALTIAEAALEPFRELLELERALEEDAEALEASGGEGPAAERLLLRYDRNLEHFRRRGGYEVRARARAALDGLGFSDADDARPLATLSGGEMVRLRLAQSLLAEPDLLLLDEPTNHLDLRSMEWLEGFLREYPGTLAVVSHDRVFLERVAEHILHLEAGTALPYTGGYERFLIQREERREHQRREFEKQQAHITRTEEFIRRNLAGQKTKQAQSRRTLLNRMERVEAPTSEGRAMAVRFDGSRRSGGTVLRLERIACGFGKSRLFEPFSAEVLRGERVALIGRNGSGKSTLLKAIAGTRPPQAGEVIQGAGVRIAYYRQDFSHLNPERTLIEEVSAALPKLSDEELRAHLARFLFSGERIESRIGDLSGGEKARVALTIATLQGANLLLLDEPTNHLDITAREALEAAFEPFSGAMIFISHDRALLDALATRIWALEGSAPVVIDDYRGTFAEWVERSRSGAGPAAKPGRVEPGRTGPDRPDPSQHALSKNEVRRRRTRLERVEQEISRAEARIAQLEEQLADPALYAAGTDPQRIRDLAAERDQLQELVGELYAEWEELGEELATAIG